VFDQRHQVAVIRRLVDHATLQQFFAIREIEISLYRFASMTFQAFGNEQGTDFFFEELQSLLHPAGMVGWQIVFLFCCRERVCENNSRYHHERN